MATKPTSLPEWASSTANILEPLATQKQSGWTLNQIPPSNFENWRSNLVFQWLDWLDDRFGDGGNEANLTLATTSDTILNAVGTGLGLMTTDAPNADEILFGSSSFGVLAGTNPRLFFASGDYIQYDSAGNDFEFRVADAVILDVNETGISNIGGQATAELSVTASALFLRADTADQLVYDRVGNAWSMQIGSVAELLVSASGVEIANGAVIGTTAITPFDDDLIVSGGLHVGFTGSNPAADTIYVGDVNFGLDGSGSEKTLRFTGTNETIRNTTSNTLIVRANNSDQLVVEDNLLRGAVTNDVALGSSTVLFSDVYASAGYFQGTASGIGGASEVGLRNLRNAIVGLAQVTSGGAENNSDNSFNISSVSRPSTGTYQIVLLNAPSTPPAIFATPRDTVDKVVSVTYSGSTATVNIEERGTGAAVNAAFSFLAVGGN